jgi:coupling of ubiquitin conjugation to ER degradation protein 1
LYPRVPAAEPGGTRPAQAQATSSAVKAAPSLIDRYNLQARAVQPGPILSDAEIGGKAVWEDSAEKREASLKERKAQMILAARQ